MGTFAVPDPEPPVTTELYPEYKPILVKTIPDEYFDSWTKLRLNLSEYFADPKGDGLTFLADYDPDAVVVNILSGGMAEIVPYHDYFGNTSVIFYAGNDKRQESSNIVTLEIVPGKEWGKAMANGLESNDASNTALILMWDGNKASIPSGWTLISDAGSGLDGRYLLASDTYTEAGGGAATHTHTFSTATSGTVSATYASGSTGSYGANATHIHPVTTYTFSPANNQPQYRNLSLIKYTGANGYPSTLPAGVIAFFNATVPTGWTRYSPTDNLLIRAAAAPNGTNSSGAQAHTHYVNFTLASPAAAPTIRPSTTGTANAVVTAAHSHTNSTTLTTNSTTNVPPYKTLILGQLNAEMSLPDGMIGMFNSTPGGYWTTISASGAAMYGKFIMGSDTYGTTGGDSLDVHAAVTGTSTAATGNLAGSTSTGGTQGIARGTHTHTSVTLSGVSAGNHTPLYSSVILGYYNKPTVIDVTINATSCDFGTQSPGAANQSATTCYPLTVSINLNTNVKTNLAVNGTTLAGSGSYRLVVNNVTYSNESTGWKTELNSTFSYGSDAAHAAYSNWVNIAIPSGSTTKRTIYWWINVPSDQGKSTYNGQLYVRVSAA